MVGLVGVLSLPGMAAWRVTADSSGLWVNGLRGSRHVDWDHIRVVRCKGSELKVDSHRASFDAWTVHGPRWPWLERKLNLVHPYEKTAAEITAMWQDPLLRPTGESGERERGRPLWPLAVVGTVAWAAVVVLTH
ncbi:PH domain-containing protein [Streptomyces sp. NPDC048275]|uniref:PH domain-containing protein n=1 Tax=Streptomyces sp. NPDC048275 TaxID=3155629 RepID=UPI003410DA3B